jgi:RimJ/RimL family protein N-acetyltransferase
MTVPANERSLRVMKRLGMTHDPGGDFDRPGMAPQLTRHVLYSLRRPANDVSRTTRRESRHSREA